MPVDSRYGPLTDRESKWMQWVIGIPDGQVGKWPLDTVIAWLASPQKYYATHAGGYARHVARLKALRTPKVRGTTVIDGHPVAGWIAAIVLEARADGVRFAVTDGIRTMAEAWWLYTHPQGYPVAYPGRTHHIGQKHPDGAVDLAPGAGNFDAWLRSHPRQARGLEWAGGKDAVHFSVPGVHRSGEADY